MRAHYNISLLALVAVACGSDGAGGGEQAGQLLREGVRAGCLERARVLDVSSQGAAARDARELLQIAEGEHGAELRWSDGVAAPARLHVRQARALWIESRDDPEFTLELERSCVDRVRLELSFELVSQDGRLQETFANVPFERDQQGELAAWFQRKRERLAGEYVRQSSASRGVLSDVYFALALTRMEFHGAVFEETLSADAAELGPSVASFLAAAPSGEQEPLEREATPAR